MSARVQDRLVFVVLLVSCFAGMAHLTTWIAIACASCLMLLSIAERQYAGNRFAASHRGIADPILILSSALNAAVFSTAAFAIGYISRAAWGF
jgi:hypothetical protein